jgi:hypothetical protein
MTKKERHDLEIQRLAADFQRRGYRVIVEPRGADTPAFLGGFSPDLLAFGSDESLVVEVVGATKRDIEDVVERVEREPGWKFLLVVPAEEGDRELALEDESVIRAQLTEPSRLLAEGLAVAALLLGWSLFEAAARRRMAMDGSDPMRAAGTEALVTRLIHLGYLEQGALAELRDTARARNRAAHGDLGVRVSRDALEQLRRATEGLLSREAA